MNSQSSMKDRVALVTGASSGLGKATALGLAQLGATVVMTGNNRHRGETARFAVAGISRNDAVDFIPANLSSQQSVRALARTFGEKYGRLDVLVNNAAAVFYKRELTVDGIESTFALNYLAPFLLTNLLLPTISASAPARIVNVVTRLGSGLAIDVDNLQGEQGYNGFRAYRHSKLALLIFTFELARRLGGDGVTANCVHPGVFRSRFGSNNQHTPLPARVLGPLVRPFMASAERAAERVLHLTSSPDCDRVTGRYFGDRKEIEPPQQALDDIVARRLWDVSIAMTNLSLPHTSGTKIGGV